MMRFCLLFSFLLCIWVSDANSQVNTPRPKTDSMGQAAMDSLPGGDTLGRQTISKAVETDSTLAALKRQAKKDSLRRANAANDTAVTYQLSNLSRYSAEINSMLQRLRRGFDTVAIHEALESIDEELSLAVAGTLDSGRRENLRNLISTKLLLVNVSRNLDAWGVKVNDYAEMLVEYKRNLYTIANDSVMRKIPADSVLRKEYFGRIGEVMKNAVTLDTLLRNSIVKIGILQNKIFKSEMMVANYLDEMDFRIAGVKRSYFSKEYGFIWQPSKSSRTLKEVVDFSYQKNKLVFKYFFSSSWALRWVHIIMIALMLGAVLWARYLLQDRHNRLDVQEAREIIRQPWTAAIFVVAILAQFTYTRPPDVFMSYLWLIIAISYTLLFYSSQAIPWRRMWWVFLLFFAAANLDYLLLTGNRAERILNLLMALAGFAASIYALRLHQDTPLRNNLLRLNLLLFILQEGVSIVANVFGRYTLAKNMMAGGYFNLMSAICLMGWVTIVSEFIYLNVEAHKRNEKLTPYFNFSQIHKGTKPILNTAAVIMWLILFTRNLNLYDPLIDSVEAIINYPLKIGSFTFDLASIFIFFLVLWVSSLIASAISFLVGGEAQQISSIKKSRFGNVVLIIRLAVLSLGFIIAIAAAGIPLDKVTIIIGALGVGIGFGLQTIVNNLVSGIILAFERPVSVGDQIEVGGRLGKVKEIGIRSSKLATFEGAEVIIPNGDLLSQHLVNWTLSNNHRRVEINVGVKYGADLNNVQKVLQDILKANDHVDKYPDPLVLVDKFGNSSIDFRLLFWTDIAGWIETKSQIIMAINTEFNKQGIEIPYPQQDVYIKTLPVPNNEGEKGE